MRKLFDDIDAQIGEFLLTHPKVKSTVRIALFTIVYAVAEHFGVVDVIQDILQEGENTT